MNILIPMAGNGSRFSQAGYKDPKPLIEIYGKRMIQWVVDNLDIDAIYTFIIQQAHENQYGISEQLRNLKKNCNIIYVNEVTEGAACTTLLAEHIIDNDKSLIIANSDQFIEGDVKKAVDYFQSYDSGILTFKSDQPKWSYAKLNDDRTVKEVAEKRVISEHATVGIYFWKHGSDYVKYAKQMIAKNIRVNNEFYVCPVFNEAIDDGQKIAVYDIDRMWGLGTPEDLKYFLTNYDFNCAQRIS